MPVESPATESKEARGETSAGAARHQDNVTQAGVATESWFAMVHTPVSIPDAKRIPAARQAVEKEWKKLEDKKAWLLDTVEEYSVVASKASAENRTIHFGQVMPLCHVKHSELAKEFHSYKGRAVFRGDNVRDEQGHLAVFSEQGTSASHIAAAKFLDALARFDGNDGEDSDAMGAYTQAEHAGEETWVHIPRDRWPAHWHGKYTRPVVRLLRALYVHPKAGHPCQPSPIPI